MTDVVRDLPQSAAVVVVRLRSLGDCVLTTPALALLRQARPDLRIGVVVEDRFAPVFEGSPDVDQLIAPSAPELRRFAPDLCLNLHGGTRSVVLTVASGARWRAGFAHYRYTGIYNIRIPRAQEILGAERAVHTAEHLAAAMFYLGVPQSPIPRARLVADPARIPSVEAPYAVLHPVAAAPEKTWSAGGFLEVAEHLRAEHNLQPVFIAGPGEDLSPFARFTILEGMPLASIKALLSRASLFVGNDSGPAHMAAAFGVPVVVMFGPSNAAVWAPWKVESRVLVNEANIRAIRVQEVLAACDGVRVTQ